MSNSSSPLLEVKNLKKYFKTPKGMLHAVDDVSFTIDRGRTLGVVGESGCGKSTTGRAILRIVEPTEGEILFDGEDIRSLGKDQMRRMRTRMQIIFQDPYASLDGRKSIFESIAEPLQVQKIYQNKKEMEEKEYEATAGGGAVTVKVSGKKEVLSVKLSEEVVDPDDIEMLEDLIVAATNEALRQLEEDSAKSMEALTGGLNLGGGFPF